MNFDVAVVGAGPAGGMAAYEAAKAGYKTVIFEDDSVVGVPVQCGEGISCYAFENLGIKPSEKFVSKEVQMLKVLFPNGRFIHLRDQGFILDRDKFDQFLVSRALDADAELRVSTRVTSLHHETGRLKFRGPQGNGEVSAKIVVGCDGPKSCIAAWSGILNPREWTPKLIKAFEYRVKGVECDAFEMYFWPDLCPEGYAWIFPKSDKVANVGIATTAPDLPGRLKKFMDKMNCTGETLKATAGGIPAHGPIEKSYTDRVMIAGDAAGQTNPVFLGGIHCSALCGRLAGQTAVEALQEEDTSAMFLKIYEDKWRSLPLADPVLIETRRILYSLNESQLNRLGNVLNNRDVSNFNDLTKAWLLVKTLLTPPNWPLFPITDRLITMMRGFSITRRWGW